MNQPTPTPLLLSDLKRLKKDAKQLSDMLGVGVLNRKEVVRLIRRGAELAETADAKDWTALMRIFTTAAALQLKLLALHHALKQDPEDEDHVPLTNSERRARLLALAPFTDDSLAHEHSPSDLATTGPLGIATGPDSLDPTAED